MKLKIAQITPYYYPSIGGVQGVVQYLSEELVKMGHIVDVLTPKRDHKGRPKMDRPSKEVINGVTILRFNSIVNLGHMSFAPGLYSHLIWKKYDVVHYHNYRHPHCEIASFIGKRKNSVTVLHGHGPFFESGEISNLKQEIYNFYDRIALKTVFKKSDIIIALNNYEAQRYIKIGVPENKIKVIPNAAESGCFLPVESEQFFSKYNLTGKKIILFIGILNSFKRPDLLVEALPKIIEKIPDAHLVLVGPDGGQLEKVKESASKFCVEKYYSWIGPLYGLEKQQALNAAKVFVLPSDWDAYPLVLMEALARGLPCIATDTRGPIDIIEHEKTGFIVKKRDVNDLADKIIKILSDDNLYNNFSKNARETALKRYKADAITKEIEKIYLEKINQ